MEQSFIEIRKESTHWRPPIELADCLDEYLTDCPINYDALAFNPYSTQPIAPSDPDEETRLWCQLGIVLPPPSVKQATFDTPASTSQAPSSSTNALPKVENSFFATSVAPIQSKREEKRVRKAERKSKLTNWFDMERPRMDEDKRTDLELLRLRPALESSTHAKKSDTKARFFQVGTVVDDPGSFYDRIPRRQRRKTIADELLTNADLMRQQRRRYANVEREVAEKRAAVQRLERQRAKRMKKPGVIVPVDQ